MLFDRWVPTAALVLACLTQSTQTTTVSLLDLLPNCSSKCIERFITTEYPRNACSKGCDLRYLCTTNTTSGYTLGEAALRCSLSLCPVGVAMSFDTYSICKSVPGALPQTHPTLVATVTASGATDTHTSSVTSTTTTDRTSTSTFQSPTSTTHSTQGSSSETNEPTSTSTESSPGPTSGEAAENAPQDSNLDSGAVIGVSVASGIAGFFIIGVIIFICCRRMRRKAQDKEFFEIGGRMSEPPDFSVPPKRPPRGPRPSPHTLNAEPKSVRLVPPEEQHQAQCPAVVVTQPEEEYGHGYGSANNAERTGNQSSKSDYETASIASSRTVSDLLPDKPTYELFPKPLYWSQHKKSRPDSGATLFEENYTNRPLPSPPLPQIDSSQLGARAKGQNRHPVAGLPANPRAMKYGFGSPGEMGSKSSGGKRPVYSNAKDLRQATSHGSPCPSSQADYDEDIENYWTGSIPGPDPDAGFVGARVIQAQPSAPQSTARGIGVNRSSYSEYPGCEFEFGFDENPSPVSRQTSRHSGGLQFRPLTPVREIRTPKGEAQFAPGGSSNINEVQDRRSGSPTKRPLPKPPAPPQEIVSRPRIVRQDDIKRVEIRRGKPSPREVNASYCPDDYWQGQNEEPAGGYNVARNFDEEDSTPAVKNVLGMPRKKPSAWERNLTLSRRGADFILQVD